VIELHVGQSPEKGDWVTHGLAVMRGWGDFRCGVVIPLNLVKFATGGHGADSLRELGFRGLKVVAFVMDGDLRRVRFVGVRRRRWWFWAAWAAVVVVWAAVAATMLLRGIR